MLGLSISLLTIKPTEEAFRAFSLSLDKEIVHSFSYRQEFKQKDWLYIFIQSWALKTGKKLTGKKYSSPFYVTDRSTFNLILMGQNYF